MSQGGINADGTIIAPDIWTVWLALAGRGFGKTKTGCEWVLNRKVAKGLGPGAIIGRTGADVRDVLVEGPAGILACSPPWNRPQWEPGKRRLTWDNGVIATVYSAEAPDQLRGPQHNWALADELAAWAYADEAWSNLMFGLRLGDHPQVAALTTPRPIDLVRQLLKDPTCAITRGSTLDNAMNLAKSAVDNMVRRYGGTRLGRQELEGELLEDLLGALWLEATLKKCIVPPGTVFVPEDFERVGVGVDPSGNDGASEEVDACGIVVAGKLKPGLAQQMGTEIIVLADITEPRSPNAWAKAACDLLDDWKGDVLVCESNFGGEMVRSTIQNYKPSAPVLLRNASRGKHVRAEPVSLLYEQGRVKHMPGLADAESELKQFTNRGYQGGSSPNRADALVWIVDELSGCGVPVPFIL